MVVNQQRRTTVDAASARAFVRRLRDELKLGGRDFNVCFVDDARIAELNARYRRKARPTDVLSFPWQWGGKGSALVSRRAGGRPDRVRIDGATEFARHLGDVVISVETARRNARREGHSTANEIRWLILHGVLHLLGYDHERDQGEMTALEHSLRERLRIVDKGRVIRRGTGKQDRCC